MCLLRRAVILYLSISLPCAAHLLAYLIPAKTLEAGLISPSAHWRYGEEKRLPSIITQLERGRAWIGTQNLKTSRRGEKQTFPPHSWVGRYPTLRAAVSGRDQKYRCILLYWHRVGETSGCPAVFHSPLAENPGQTWLASPNNPSREGVLSSWFTDEEEVQRG